VTPGLAGWLLYHLAGGYARAQPWRALVQIAAIAAGVALGYAVNLINAAALGEFAAAEQTLSGSADAALVADQSGFDEAWYARIANDPAVAFASPVLEIDAALALQRTAGTAPVPGSALRILGIDALRSALLTPDLVGVPARTDAKDPLPLLSGGIFLAAAASAKLHGKVGKLLPVVVGDRIVDLPIVGTLPRARGAIAVMDLGFAQWRFARLGKLTRIDIRFVPGIDIAAAERSWHLTGQLHLEVAQTAVDREQGLSRSYRVNLNVLALMALFTGAFLVFSLQSQAAIARRSQLALLRMLGATRATVMRMLLGEALLFGVLGSLLGLTAGAALAGLGLHLLGGDLGGGYFSGIEPRLRIEPLTAMGFFLLGLAAALAGAWLPARHAGKQAPAPAMKAGADGPPDAQPPLVRLAAMAFVLGFVLLALPPVHGVPIAAYLAIATLLLATIGIKPLVTPPLFAALARFVEGHRTLTRCAPAWLAATRLAREPRFAAAGAAGIVASFALMVAMVVMVGSFRNSFDLWLSQVLRADVYVRAAGAGTTATLARDDEQILRADPDVVRFQFSRILRLSLDPARAPVTLIARNIDPAEPGRQIPILESSRAVAAPAVAVWVSEAMLDLYGARPGSRLQLPLAVEGAGSMATRPEFVVAGVWRDYARQEGSIVMNIEDYQRITGDRTRTDAALWLRPAAKVSDVAQRLFGTLHTPAVQIVPQTQIRAISLRLFDRSFRVTYVLEWAAIFIGLVGLGATFSAQAIARTREFGMLRHVGVTRRQVQMMLTAEAGLVTLVAAVLGLIVGLAIAAILVHVVNPQSFHWTMELQVPVPELAGLSICLLVAAALTSLAAGRRALSFDAIRAVKDDW